MNENKSMQIQIHLVLADLNYISLVFSSRQSGFVEVRALLSAILVVRFTFVCTVSLLCELYRLYSNSLIRTILKPDVDLQILTKAKRAEQN